MKNIHPVRLGLAPLAIAAIAIATAVPLELRPAVRWDGGFDTLDFVQNLILYAPLGAALSHRSSRAVLLLAAALSLGAELIQVWSFERFSSPYDVLANVLGAFAGTWLWRRYRPSRIAQVALGGPAIFGCLLLAALMYANWKAPIESSDIDDWDTSFPIVLGNESSGGRPWQGTISAMRILSGPLSSGQVRKLEGIDSSDAHDDKLRISTLYENATTTAFDGGPAVALRESLSRELVREITSAGGFTLMLRLRPADVMQRGPARILSFSRNTQERNFDLGQEQDRLTLRVRTRVSGRNGENFRAETVRVLQPRTDTLVVATYDGSISRIFVSGQLSGRSNLAAAGCVVSTMCGSALPVVWAFFGATLAILALALTPGIESSRRFAFAVVSSGCAAGALPLLPTVFPDWATSPAWMKAMPLFGALAVCVAALIRAPADRQHDDVPQTDY